MLQLAVSGGHHTIAKALIEGRAAVNNVSNVTGTTPLLIAVMQVAVNLYANIHLTSMLHTTTIHAAQTCIQHAMQICVKHTYNTQYATCVRHVYMHHASAWMVDGRAMSTVPSFSSLLQPIFLPRTIKARAACLALAYNMSNTHTCTHARGTHTDKHAAANTGVSHVWRRVCERVYRHVCRRVCSLSCRQ